MGLFKREKPEHILSKEELEEFKKLKEEKKKTEEEKKNEVAVDNQGIQHKKEDASSEQKFIEDLVALIEKYGGDIEPIKIYGYMHFYANLIMQSNE
jgi:hypothetical protein